MKKKNLIIRTLERAFDAMLAAFIFVLKRILKWF